MSRVILPFNYQPVVSEVKQGSFSIPLGQYARVVPISDDLSIDGVSACLGNATTFSTSSAIGTVYPIGSASQPMYVAWNRTSGGVVGRLDIGGVELTATSQSGSFFLNGIISPSSGVSVTPSASDSLVYFRHAGGTGSFNVQVFSIHKPKEIWVTAGTALSGQRYIVELYNMLT